MWIIRDMSEYIHCGKTLAQYIGSPEFNFDYQEKQRKKITLSIWENAPVAWGFPLRKNFNPLKF